MITKEAIILAGGLGTRLKGVVKDIPKPMAPVGGRPFLEYLLIWLEQYHINRVILSVGYKYEAIKDYFGDRYNSIDILYAIEEQALGTGGGIKNALSYAKSNHVLLLNGDTFFKVDPEKLERTFIAGDYDLCFSLKKLQHFDRYGVVLTKDELVTGFKDKMYVEEGLINGGVYLIKTNIFNSTGLPVKFSFENDYLAIFKNKHVFGYVEFESYFIDIGIPEDYIRAETEVPEHIK